MRKETSAQLSGVGSDVLDAGDSLYNIFSVCMQNVSTIVDFPVMYRHNWHAIM